MDKQRQRILQQINEIMAQKNSVEMYSTHSEGKSVVAERFIRNLKKHNLWFQKMSILINQMIQLINEIIHIVAQLK